jgi:hypothetical protein
MTAGSWPLAAISSADGDLAQLSPDYGDQEIGHIWDGSKFATPYLLPEVVALDLTKTDKLSVPLIRLKDKIMFGSDYPSIPHARFLREWDELGYSADIMERVFHRNAERVLGL